MFTDLKQTRDILAPLVPEVSSLPFSRSVWVEVDGVKALLVRITYVGEVLQQLWQNFLIWYTSTPGEAVIPFFLHKGGGGELFLVCGKYHTACLQLGYELHVPWGKCGQVLASLEREKGGELNCAGMEVADIQFNMMSRFFFNRQWRIWQWRRVTNIGQQIYRFSVIQTISFQWSLALGFQ